MVIPYVPRPFEVSVQRNVGLAQVEWRGYFSLRNSNLNLQLSDLEHKLMSLGEKMTSKLLDCMIEGY